MNADVVDSHKEAQKTQSADLRNALRSARSSLFGSTEIAVVLEISVLHALL
jgi:hypothetical protein